MENFKYKTIMTSLQQEYIILQNDINDKKKKTKKKFSVLILDIFNFNIQQHEKLRECSFVEVKTKHSRWWEHWTPVVRWGVFYLFCEADVARQEGTVRGQGDVAEGHVSYGHRVDAGEENLLELVMAPLEVLPLLLQLTVHILGDTGPEG